LRNLPADKYCARCGLPHYERHAQVHSSERSVIYYNPATGEHRTPPRADMPLPEVYKQQGYERKEILSMIQYEKETGIVHESSNYQSGNEPVALEPAPPRPSQDAIRAVAEDIKEAISSGPWRDDAGLLGI